MSIQSTEQTHVLDETLAVLDVEEDDFAVDNGNSGNNLDVGDHVYSWRGAGAWSHHGIVISVTKVLVAILDFFPEMRWKGQRRHQQQCDDESDPKAILRVVSAEEWKATYGTLHKVIYSAGYLRRTFCRSGTCTSCESAPPFLVLARVRFLLASSEGIIPTYHTLYSNSETAAFWCKTGYWSTLQVADFLHLTFAGQLKSSVTLGAYVSTQTVTVPAAGIWGYLGFTTKVTLASTQPLLLPLIAGYGLITVGSPLYMLYQCRFHWDTTTKVMHEEFWSSASNDLIVECIVFWSKRPKNSDKT
jgi:hypothetical protein